MLDAASAKALIAPLYQALTSSSPDMVAPLLDKATSPDWMNCSSNDACQTKAQTIQRWTSRIGVVPDMQWTEKEIIVAASHIVARGEVSGTPAGPFLGVVPQGRSFKIMTIDIHQVRDGKIVHTYHLEDWAAAIRQLSTPAGTP